MSRSLASPVRSRPRPTTPFPYLDLTSTPHGRLPQTVARYVQSSGKSNFTPPRIPDGLQGRNLQEFKDQFDVRGFEGRPDRKLSAMPVGAFDRSHQVFLDPKNPQVMGTHFLWALDPFVGVPYIFSPASAVQNPRGIAVLLHGSGTQNSTLGSLQELARKLQKFYSRDKEGFHTVLVPKPFHRGFFSDAPAEKWSDINFYMEEYLRRVIASARDIYAHIGGERLPLFLIGRSTGGNEVLEFAHRFPDDIDAAVAISPYHHGWSFADDMILQLGSIHGLVDLNKEGLQWTQAMDGGWTFLGRDIPSILSFQSLSQEGARALFESVAPVSSDQRRNLLRAHIMERVPHEIRSLQEALVPLDDATTQRFSKKVGFPLLNATSPLATTQVSTLLYAAAPDLEYNAADPWHFLIWGLAAQGNGNVRVMMAPYGDHDPFKGDVDLRTRAVGKAFEQSLKGWFDSLFPSSPARRELSWEEKIWFFDELKESLDAQHIPTEAELRDLQARDPQRAADMWAKKKISVHEVARRRGIWMSYEDIVSLADTITNGGYLNVGNRAEGSGVSKKIARAVARLLGVRRLGMIDPSEVRINEILERVTANGVTDEQKGGVVNLLSYLTMKDVRYFLRRGS